VDALASTAEPEPQSRFVHRLIRAREDDAKRIVRAHLAVLDDGRLRSLGFSDDDIGALRAGELRLPR
jgi:hypothetical protein